MRKNDKLFYYSEEDGTLKEVRYFRRKGAIILLVSILVILGSIIGLNHIYYNFLNMGYRQNAILEMENKTLREQVKNFASKLEMIEKSFGEFVERDTELRLHVDLPVIDEDTRQAGVGGVTSDWKFTNVSGSTGELLYTTTRQMERLEREIKLQKQSFQEIQEKYSFNEDYYRYVPAIKPAEGSYNSHGFGRRRHPILGVTHFHGGIDIACDVGTRVHATADGVVEMAGRSSGGYGRMVVINHGYGYKTLYAHLSTLYVKRGDRIQRGDVIALSGRSGLVTGPHLHYEVIYNNVKQNPIDFFFDDIDYNKAKQEFARTLSD